MLLISAGLSAQTVLYVDDDAPSDGDGLTWDTAFRFLQDALSNAAIGTEIYVAQGVYLPDRDEANAAGTGDREAAFQLVNGITLMGGYGGLGEANPDDRDLDAYPTILSGDLPGDDSFHVVTGSGTDDTAVLDGFTITAGNANAEDFPHDSGGGMLNISGSPTVSACRFEDNAAIYGCGMANIDSSPTVIECTFSGNHWAEQGYDDSPSAAGGGMYNLRSEPTVTRCDFVENIVAVHSPWSGSGGPGGGMCNKHSHPAITDCTFTGNRAHHGGGLYNSQSSPSIAGCAFSENAALPTGSPPGDFGGGGWIPGRGAGMFNGHQCNPTVTDCTFTGNTGDGNGMYNHSSDLTVVDCEFSANEGTGMTNVYSNPTVTGCTFSSNGAHGMSYGISSPTVIGCTFSSNAMDGMNSTDGLSNPTVIDCTFTENRSGIKGGKLTVIGCTFTDNSTTTWAGGLRHAGGLILGCTFRNNTGSTGGGISTGHGIVANCLFANNSAARGAGLFCGEPVIANCTFVDNVATEEGGGIFSCSYGAPLVSNCIFRGNSAGISGDQLFFCDYEGLGVPRIAFTNVEGSGGSSAWDPVLGTDGGGNIDADPMFADPDNGDYRLLAGSPSIDAGHNNAIAQQADTDLDGNPRFADDPTTADTGCGATAVVDMGAYEFQGEPAEVTFADLNGDGVIGMADFEMLVNCWASSDEPCCVSDLDLDGVVGVVDFRILLANWG
jgi:parallel beta-helix repeat protein